MRTPLAMETPGPSSTLLPTDEWCSTSAPPCATARLPIRTSHPINTPGTTMQFLPTRAEGERYAEGAIKLGRHTETASSWRNTLQARAAARVPNATKADLSSPGRSEEHTS